MSIELDNIIAQPEHKFLFEIYKLQTGPQTDKLLKPFSKDDIWIRVYRKIRHLFSLFKVSSYDQ